MPSPQRPHSTSAPSARASTGLAIRRGDIKISDPLPFSFAHTAGPGSNQEAPPQPIPRLDGTWPRKSIPSGVHGRSASSAYAEADMDTRVSVGPSIITSTMSSAPSKGSLAQKKTGGFRATIKRMFGSKRHRSSVSEVHKDYHRSDPGNLTSIGEVQTPPTVSQASAPRGQSVTQASALGSHAPPASFRPGALDHADPDRVLPMHKRRNTLPSLVLSDHEAQVISARLATAQTSSRPSTAIRDGAASIAQLKRRSRSADALTELILSSDAASADRPDRTSEIAYWRNSLISNPLPVVPTRPSRSTAAPQQRDCTTQKRQTSEEALRSIQSFDFGLDDGSTPPATLEQRVNTLEVKMFDFEYAIAKLQGIELPKPTLPTKAAKRKSIHDVSHESSAPPTLALSPIRDYTFFTYPVQSPMSSTENEEVFQSQRASNGTTIRPIKTQRKCHRSPASSRSSVRLTADQFETIMALIQDEKAARQQMEMQILDLQKKVDVLHAPVYASVRPTHYPTPSPESLHETPMVPRVKLLHRSPPFQLKKTPPQQETSRFSMSESEPESHFEDPYEDVYETPQENRYTFEVTRGSPLVDMF